LNLYARKITALLPAALGAALLYAAPGRAQSATSEPEDETINVEQLFAGTCGFCHSDGGRVAGKGPQLMNSPRDDEFLFNRIAGGKQGAMPAFGGSFTGPQIDQMVKYIRALKPR